MSHRFSTVAELRQKLDSGAVSCEELTKFFLKETNDRNNELNAFTYIAEAKALKAAKNWDRKRKHWLDNPSFLAGIPMGVKDLALYRGMPVRFGSAAVPKIVSPIDDEIAKMIRKTGSIVVGKLATSEFGAMPITSPDIHPPTRCPHNLSITAGGSSGGSGAAVAAGMIPIAHGTDGGGSIRIPAAINHLVGIKASRGAIVFRERVDKELGMTAMGPLARSVEDVAGFLEMFTQFPTNYRRHLDRDLGTGLRVAVSTSNFMTDTHHEYAAAAERVGKLFESAGATLVDSPWFEAKVEDFMCIWQRLMGNVPVFRPEKMQPVTRWLNQTGKTIPKDDATAKRIEMENQVKDWFGLSDIWISPTLATQPGSADDWQKPTPEETFDSVLGYGAFTAIFNVGGQPAMTVPCGLDDNGTGIGVQIVGRPGSDLLVMQAARFVEKSLGGFIREID